MADKKTKENIYKNGLFTGVYKGDSGNMLTATQMIYEVNGDEVVVNIENDFKLLYTFLYDQYRSFQVQKMDLFAEWETIFKAIGRSYNTKSKAMVKLLEDCGLLKQIKMPNDNRRIKIVADVSLKNIRFINPDYDKWREEQKANNAERVAEFAEFNAEKEKAIKQAKNVETKTVKSESKIEPVANIENTAAVVDTKPTIQEDISYDDFLEEYNKPYGSINSKPKTNLAAKPPKPNYQDYGRKCSQCYQNSNGDWDCKDDWCSNCIPF
ncbi:DUF6945 domain-containing protein [Aeromonas veronii]